MTCERYWREGIELVERDEPDPHRATCADCRRAHAARNEIVHALPMIGGHATGDPQWQARVWRQIARERSTRTMWRCASGAFAAACVTTLLWLVVCDDHERPRGAAAVATASAPPGSESIRRAGPSESSGVEGVRAEADLPSIEIISGPVAMRSTIARVGDRVRISAFSGSEIRVYRADKLVLQCSAAATSEGCVARPSSLVAETAFATPGDYQLVVIRSGVRPPAGSLAEDLAAIVKVQGEYQLRDLSIR